MKKTSLMLQHASAAAAAAQRRWSSPSDPMFSLSSLFVASIQTHRSLSHTLSHTLTHTHTHARCSSRPAGAGAG